MENKYFKCFKCHFHNHFYIPHRIKGKKCKRCKIFNYFNYFKKNNNNTRNRNRNNLNQSSSNFNVLSRANRLGNINNNLMNRNPHRENVAPLISNENRIDRHNNILNFNNFVDINSIDDERDNNNNENDYLHDNFYQIFSLNNQNNIFINNINNDNINNNNIFNHIYNDNFENNIYHQNIEENVDVSWIKKEKLTKHILDKYGKDYECSICLSNLEGDIYITKCGHVFHYKCIVDAVKKKINECPNCRANLKTGEKKQDNNNIRHINQNNNDNRDNRNDHIAINANNNQNNINNRNIRERNNNQNNEVNQIRNDRLNLGEKNGWDIFWMIMFWLFKIILYFICGVAIIVTICCIIIVFFYVLIIVLRVCLAIGFLYFLLKCFGV